MFKKDIVRTFLLSRTGEDGTMNLFGAVPCKMVGKRIVAPR